MYATYANDGKNSVIGGLAVDSDGYAYLALTGVQGGQSSGFVSKLNQTGNEAVWTVAVPSAASAPDIALDAIGNVYAIGNTVLTLPFVRLQPPGPPGNIALVVKYAPDGQKIVYSTGIAEATVIRIALDSTGSAYVLGYATSNFQPTPGAYSTSPKNAPFVAKLGPEGKLEYATYVDLISAQGIAVDSKGEAWVVGYSCPQPAGPGCDTSRAGTASAIQKLDAQGATVLVSKVFGGGRVDFLVFRDTAGGIAIDGDDAVWIVGAAQSSGVPTTPNEMPEVHGGANYQHGYVVKLSSAGDVLYGSYVPSGGTQVPMTAIAVDSQRNAYFGQNTTGRDSYVMGLSPDGSTARVWQYYPETVQVLGVDGNGGLYAGTSLFQDSSPGDVWPILFNVCPTTPGAYQPFGLTGNSNICLAKFDLTQNGPAPVRRPVNSASLQWNAVAPGEMVTLFGSNLPSNPTVAFDGIAAPVLYADASQINTVVPFEATAPLTALTVEGVAGLNLAVVPAAPGIFTVTGTGSGQITAFNEDGTMNSSSNPAPAGSNITVFITGAGAMSPALADGQLGPVDPPYAVPVLPITATLWRVSDAGYFESTDAPVTFASQAPGLIAGVVQLNIQIPSSAGSGDNRLVVQVGDALSPDTVAATVAVQ